MTSPEFNITIDEDFPIDETIYTKFVEYYPKCISQIKTKGGVNKNLANVVNNNSNAEMTRFVKCILSNMHNQLKNANFILDTPTELREWKLFAHMYLYVTQLV